MCGSARLMQDMYGVLSEQETSWIRLGGIVPKHEDTLRDHSAHRTKRMAKARTAETTSERSESNGGQYWIRTSDLHNVNVAL